VSHNDSVPSVIPTWSSRVVQHLRSDPDRTALISVTPEGTETWSRADLASYTAGAVDFLDACDARRGDAVPALVVSRPTSVALLLAGAETGRPLAPLAPRLTARELIMTLRRIPGDLVVADPQFAELATDVATAVGKHVVVVRHLEAGVTQLQGNSDPRGVGFVMHTSGTTGTPKQIPANETALARRAEVNGRVCGLHSGTRLVTAALFHHVAGVGNVSAALGSGSATVMFPQFSVDAWRQLEAVEPTHAILVPSMIEMLLTAGALDIPSMRVIGYGGSPIHPNTMRRVQQVIPGVDFVNLFGQTEGSPLTVLTADDHRAAVNGSTELLRSVGRPAPGVELRIDQPDGAGVGEVWARCGHSFVVDENGWQHTGDIGRIDDGYLYLVGRRGDKIIRGGENIFPLEVEQILESHPAIAAAGVIGRPDARLGETVVAFIVAADGVAAPDPDELRRYCRARLASFKVPADWIVVDALPRNANGKLVRRDLAALAVEH
jgi:acyl-CoA synthetase (AMP-forming)/AMP-acid ligase II